MIVIRTILMNFKKRNFFAGKQCAHTQVSLAIVIGNQLSPNCRDLVKKLIEKSSPRLKTRSRTVISPYTHKPSNDCRANARTPVNNGKDEFVFPRILEQNANGTRNRSGRRFFCQLTCVGGKNAFGDVIRF